MIVRLRCLGLLLAVAWTGGCVTGQYRRVNVNEPRMDTEVLPLLAESAGLQACLDALGAPNFVWPTDDGTAIAYAHSYEKGWGVRASAPIRRVSGSVTYRSSLADGQAVVLFFDDDWVLRFMRRGKLADILQDNVRRVQPVAPRG